MNRFSGRTGRVSFFASIAIGALAISLVQVGAIAQPGGDGGGRGRGGFGGFGGGFGRGGLEPGVNSREMETFTAMLALTADQKEAVNALFEAYQQEFNDAAKEVREKMETLREEMRGGGGDPGAWQSIADDMQKFRKQGQEMETAFFNDVKTVLTPEQAEVWPRVERTHRRDRTISRGLMSGERVNIIEIVDELKLPDDAEEPLKPVLEQYEVDLDRELIKRNEVQEAAMGRFRELFMGGDEAEMQKVFDEGRAASTRVRDVNSRYARQIEAMLPDEPRAAFADQVRRQSFPMIYRPSYGLRVVDAAAAFEDLDENQRSAIQTIKATYTRELDALNRQWETEQVKREESFGPQDLMRGGMRGGMDNEEIQDIRDRRRELESGTIEKVKALLTEEQNAKLPEREGRGRGEDGGQRRERDGGGEGDQPRRRPPQRDQAPPDSRV